MSKNRKYSCLSCGTPIEVYPPDQFHPIASLQKDKVADPIEMTVICTYCDKKTKLYWGTAAL